MAMFVIQKLREGKTITSDWHVGEPMPEIIRPVVTFQADGDELELLLHAMGGPLPRLAR